MSEGRGPSGTVDERIVIARPVEDVFAFYQDFRNLPAFLGDVMRVEPTGDGSSRWTIQGPLGVELHWTVVVTELRANVLIAYETQSAAGPTRWKVSFSPGTAPDTTVVRETMTLPGGRIAQAALAAIGKPPAEEVRANLQRLKELLETGRVTTTDHAVAGKFRF